MKSVQKRRFFWLHFPAFGRNTEWYFVSLRIQSECGKIRTRKNSVSGYFSRNAHGIGFVNVFTCPCYLLQLEIKNFGQAKSKWFLYHSPDRNTALLFHWWFIFEFVINTTSFLSASSWSNSIVSTKHTLLYMFNACKINKTAYQFFAFIDTTFRSSRPELFSKKGILKNFAKLQENTCARVSFSIKLQTWGSGSYVFLWVLRNF